MEWCASDGYHSALMCNSSSKLCKTSLIRPRPLVGSDFIYTFVTSDDEDARGGARE